MHFHTSQIWPHDCVDTSVTFVQMFKEGAEVMFPHLAAWFFLESGCCSHVTSSCLCSVTFWLFSFQHHSKIMICVCQVHHTSHTICKDSFNSFMTSYGSLVQNGCSLDLAIFPEYLTKHVSIIMLVLLMQIFLLMLPEYLITLQEH